MRTALVFGGSGQIGQPLLQRLVLQGWAVLAVSRAPRANEAGVRWLRGDLARVPALPARVDAVFSCGPLDLFAAWFAAGGPSCERVVAFGSTSQAVKQASPDPAERALARRLAEAEARLFAGAGARGAAATVLRPTLVYGMGLDRSLTRLAGLARRRGWLPLPRGADGLRQPVHAEDLAEAALAACDAPAAAGLAFDTPGGETLAYREMVRRTLAALEPPARLLEVPGPLFGLMLAALRIAGRGAGLGDAAVARLREDLVFDPAPAQQAFGYAPRPFRPTAAMVTPPR